MNNISKGYKLVPVVATLEMKNAGWRECDRQGIEPESIEMQTIWTAMHLEAPAPPQPIYDEAKERELFKSVYFRCDLSEDWLSGAFKDKQTRDMWDGWRECAQYRAKAGEDE